MLPIVILRAGDVAPEVVARRGEFGDLVRARVGDAWAGPWREHDVRTDESLPDIGAAVRLIGGEKYGYMVAHRPPDTDAILITEAIGRLRTVPPDCDIIRTGRALGISFGD